MRLNLSRVHLMAALLIGVGCGLAWVRAADEPKEKPAEEAVKRVELMSQKLPGGNYTRASMLTIDYAPGGASPKHRHDAAVLAYVLEGSVECQFDGGDLKTYKQGDTWYEAPGTIHGIARNASKTERAKLLVTYVQVEGKAPTTILKEEK